MRFVPTGGAGVTLDDVALSLGGRSRPELVRAEEARGDALVLTIPAIGVEVILTATISGSRAGTLLINRL